MAKLNIAISSLFSANVSKELIHSSHHNSLVKGLLQYEQFLFLPYWYLYLIFDLLSSVSIGYCYFRNLFY